MDQDTSLQSLKDQVESFCAARDWDQFHSGKELAIGAVTEAAELLEPFRFQSKDQVEALLRDEKQRQAIGEELADVLFFLLRFAQRYGFDLSECFKNKMLKNDKKYPAEEFRGQNYKSKN